MRKILKPFEWRVKTIRNIFVLVLVFVITFAVYSLRQIEDKAIWAETTRVGTDKEVIANAGSERMIQFFNRVESDLRLLLYQESDNSGFSLEHEELTRLLEVVIKKYEGTPIISVARLDKDGLVVRSANKSEVPSSLGVSLSDRDYFIWAKKQKDQEGVFLSNPLMPRGSTVKRGVAVVLAVPVFKSGNFDGVIFMGLDLKELVDEYVDRLSSYDGSLSLLLDKDGVILLHALDEENLGKNINNILKNWYPEREEEYQLIISEILSEKNSWVSFNYGKREQDTAERWIVGFAPVIYGEKEWHLAVMVPKNEAVGRLADYKKQVKLSIFGIGIVFLILGFLWILGMRRAQLHWFERGVKRGRELLQAVSDEDKTKSGKR